MAWAGDGEEGTLLPMLPTGAVELKPGPVLAPCTCPGLLIVIGLPPPKEMGAVILGPDVYESPDNTGINAKTTISGGS